MIRTSIPFYDSLAFIFQPSIELVAENKFAWSIKLEIEFNRKSNSTEKPNIFKQNFEFSVKPDNFQNVLKCKMTKPYSKRSKIGIHFGKRGSTYRHWSSWSPWSESCTKLGQKGFRERSNTAITDRQIRYCKCADLPEWPHPR